MRHSHALTPHFACPPRRSLRVVNPSPYMAYLQARGCIIVASSPEILCRVGEDGRVTNRCVPCWLTGSQGRAPVPRGAASAPRQLCVAGKAAMSRLLALLLLLLLLLFAATARLPIPTPAAGRWRGRGSGG